ncbi:hypothetical protein [Aerosakkonema funiforme]|uniref:hypothetical protein n=1 Tax=Aerosakkonema funiforme TaxID=1246630 RepID=UPI0035BB621E
MRWIKRTVPIAIVSLAAVIGCQPIKSSSIVNSTFNQPEVSVLATQQTATSQGWNNVALGGGGYVTGIYLHPLEKDLVYIKTDVGGFYRWNSQSQSWMPLTDRFPLSQRHYYGGEALAFDPKNPNIVYIAAGTYVWDKPGTIFKSTDKGQTWTKLNIDLPMGGNQDKRWVGERLAVNLFNTNVILFGSRQNGLWKSSNAGRTWSKVTSFPGTPKKDIGITAILFDKQMPGLVYAVAYGDGIYKSTDTGVTWRKIAGSPQWPRRMATGRNGTLYVTSGKGPGVTKYANGVWSNITPENSQAMFNGLSVNPANPDEIVVALGESPSTKIYRSVDAGSTWIPVKRTIDSTVPWWTKIMRSQAWISAIEFDPKVTGRVWLTDWYGIWRTDDLKTNPVVWTNYQKGHEEIVTFALVSPPKGALLLSGLADVDGFYHNNGLASYPDKTFGGNGPDFQDTYSIAYNEKDPLKVVRVGGNRWNNSYSGTTSTDGGLTWQKFGSFPTNKMPMRVAMSATDPNVFVVTISGGQAIRTIDGGATWQPVSGLPNGPRGPWNWSQSLAADTVDGNTFYYYWNDSVYRSTDKGASFSVVYKPLVGENRWHSLKTMPGVKGEVWVSLDEKGLYRSTDAGKSFSKISGVEKAYLFAFGKPQEGSTIPALYLYGKIARMGEGIFRSLDRGKTWTNIGDRHQPIGNNPQVMAASKQQFGLVFIGTGGRGIYYYSK